MSDRARRWMVAAAAVATSAGAADRPDGVFHKVAKAGDGVRVAMFRYAPAAVDRQKPSVLLVSDFGFSSRAFDLRELGLARYLASHGFETFSFDWRGSGASESPADFTIASLVEQDLPAVVDGTGSARLLIVGWGFGGTAALAYAAHAPDRVLGVVAANAPLRFDVPNALSRGWLNEAPSPGLVALPGGPGRSEGSPIFNMLYAHGNDLPPAEVEHIRRDATGRVGAHLRQELSAWAAGSLPSLFGKPLDELGRSLDRPVLLMLAPRDNWTHPEFAEPWVDVLTHLAVQPCGWADGYGEDYGHLGLLFAKDARHRAWARIAAFAEKPGE